MSGAPYRFRTALLKRTLDVLRPTWALVDLDAAASNLKAIRARVGPDVRILAVVKADAYGHGAVPVARALREAGADFFGVALVEEGCELREAGIEHPILMLGGITPAQASWVVSLALTPSLFTRDAMEAMARALEEKGIQGFPWHLKVDTGMGRLGVVWDRAVQFLRDTRPLRKRMVLEGVFTALAAADDPESRFTDLQVRRFRQTVAEVETLEGPVRWKHVANSAAIYTHPPSWINLVRPGIALYGMSPGPSVPVSDMRPVLALRTEILYLKTVPQGSPIGYGGTYVTGRESRIATIPAGYDDGLVRLLSEGGRVLVRGVRVPIVGRISMDLATVDVTDVPGVQGGDDVVLIGEQGGERILAEEIAREVRTIPYEVTCGIGRRVPRVYLRGGEAFEIRSRFGISV